MINFAVVGCGHIAQKHIEAISVTEGARLAALCDTDPVRLEQTGAEFDGVLRYRSLTDLLSHESAAIDVVCLCIPSGLHAPLAVQAASAGKHLLIEKPLALTVDDLDSIEEAVERSGVKAGVVHPNRFRPAMVELKRALMEERFGKISHVNATVRWNRGQAYYDQAPWRGTRSQDGGVLLNQAIHSLDLLQWLMGPVTAVKAMIDTRIRNIEAEDVAVATLKFAEGALGVVEAATTIYSHNLEESISVFGEHGYAVVGGTIANRILHWRCDSMTEEEQEAIVRRVNVNPVGIPGHHQLIHDMVRAITEHRDPAVTLAEGRDAVKLALSIMQDATAGSHPLVGIGGAR